MIGAGLGAAPAAENASGQRRFAVFLGVNPHDHKAWRYIASPEGIVEETSPDPGEDEILPGCATFVFIGSREGDVDLSFIYVNPARPEANPLNFAAYRLRVHPDQNIEAITQYKEYGLAAGPGHSAVSILLGAMESDPPSGSHWSYTASREGIVAEGSLADLDDFEDEAGEGVAGIGAEEIPGARTFVFKGVNQGEVDLFFTYAGPDGKTIQPKDAARFKLKVFPDLTLNIIGSSRETY
ncbi:MAG: protease inhibitor I42 family protein [Planctomycetota bacterium]|nr:protease inhibitor I42 family protein [Planctomycetota bacterium]